MIGHMRSSAMRRPSQWNWSVTIKLQGKKVHGQQPLTLRARAALRSTSSDIVLLTFVRSTVCQTVSVHKTEPSVGVSFLTPIISRGWWWFCDNHHREKSTANCKAACRHKSENKLQSQNLNLIRVYVKKKKKMMMMIIPCGRGLINHPSHTKSAFFLKRHLSELNSFGAHSVHVPKTKKRKKKLCGVTILCIFFPHTQK